MEVVGLIKKMLPDAVVDDAVLDAIALSACADGVVKEEMDAMRRMARELPSSRSLDEAAIEARIEASFARIHDDGLDARLEAIANAALDDDTRKRMFTAAAIVQYADGHVTNEENEFLLDLADALGLDEARVRAIVSEIEKQLGIG
ncbi:MAG TPA: TerB family tellurite resistance protein [Labilithrix sp.]|jgi:tellurite resistance protein